jgi:hypothetical protein
MRRLSLLISLLFMPFMCFTANAQTTHDGETELMRGFARAVAISDGAVFIGEPANLHQPGAVYVFTKSGMEWSQQSQFLASDGVIGDRFGSSLSANGNMVLVGAPDGNNENGSAYIFAQNSSGDWVESEMLTVDAAESGFGSSVLLSGNYAFIGAPDHNDGLGSVLVYQRSGSGEWTQTTSIANPDTSTSNFGSVLAMDNMNLVIGAPEREGGAAYVFENEGGEWTSTATLSTWQVDQRGQFASSLNISGDQIFVGAPGHSSGSGAVVVFSYNSDEESWTQSGRLLPYDGQPRYAFGVATSVTDEGVWVGAPNADSRSGAIYQFQAGEGGSWDGVSKMKSDQGAGDAFAGTLVIEGNVAVVGLVGADFGSGSAAIMERNSSGMWMTQEIVIGK